MNCIAIIGAGNSGMAMAAHLSLEGHSVRLWNRTASNIEQLRKNNLVKCEGILKGSAKLERITTDITEVLSDVKLIMVTTPASSHREIAYKIAPYLKENTSIVLNPGRTFGAIEFAHVLSEVGCRTKPNILETQTIIYTCRKTGPDSVSVIALKKDVLTAGLCSVENSMVKSIFPECLQKHITVAETMIETSFGNVGMILHCVPILLNSGWIESPKTQFKYYYEGITPSVSRLLEKLDNERIHVSAKLGCAVESTADWLKRSYGVIGEDLYTCIQNNEAYKTIDAPTSLAHRYIFEDVPCGLVPLEAIGKFCGLPMEITGMIIDLASEIINIDFREEGRNLRRLGLEKKSIDDISSILRG